MTIEERPGELPVRVDERVSVREATPEDFEAIVEVLDASFEGWPVHEVPASALEHLRWKLGGPYGGEHPSFVAEFESEMIGVITWLPRRALVRGELMRVIDGGDRAILPEHQGSGRGRSMQYAGDSDLSNVHVRLSLRGRTYDQRVRERHRRAGTMPVGNAIQNLMLPLDVRQLSAERASGGSRLPVPVISLLTQGLRVANYARYGWRRRAAVSGDVTIRGVEAFDERVDGFFAVAGPQFDFIIARSPEYLNWRFCDPRGGRFEVRLAEEGDLLVGYSVLKVEDGRGFIADLLALPDRLDVVGTLVDDAVSHFKGVDAAGVFCWLPKHHPYQRPLHRAGFLNTRRRLPYQYTEGHLVEPGSLAFLQDPGARVHAMMGDRDVI